MVDNTTAVAYINNMGGRKLACQKITKKIWLWCKNRGIWLSAAYLPSKENVVADKMSRKDYDKSSEWALNESIFQKTCKVYGKPEIDMFATRLNHKCKRYVSWHPDPYAEAVDAFSVDWSSKLLYIFPPFCLISKVLQKIEQDKANAIIIVPLWTTQPWWSKLIRLLTTCPLYFSRNRESLTHPVKDPDSLPRMLLLTCLISWQPSKRMNYHQKHKTSLCVHGANPPPNSTKLISLGGKNLQLHGKSIAIHPVWQM